MQTSLHESSHPLNSDQICSPVPKAARLLLQSLKVSLTSPTRWQQCLPEPVTTRITAASRGDDTSPLTEKSMAWGFISIFIYIIIGILFCFVLRYVALADLGPTM